MKELHAFFSTSKSNPKSDCNVHLGIGMGATSPALKEESVFEQVVCFFGGMNTIIFGVMGFSAEKGSADRAFK